MNYIIRKDVKGFYYYLGVGGKWEGLITNGITFNFQWEAEKQIRTLLTYFPNDKFDVITINN